jgi:V/A-type H+-transporting ATPase subunit F
MRIVAVGDTDFIAGFQLAGVKDVYEASDSWKAKNALEIIRDMHDVAIVIIQRRFAREIRDYINEWKESKWIYPIILELPDHRERGEHEDQMRDVIKRAIGIDMMKR